ncbi:hypothetical protein NAC44_14035 [Allorhizobium sp. BGMRC 0089]|uniref:darcynin family protein n=1 Tax=Allorhizobium sonneratiae TaxID=2934936 RepID=UPI00203323A2|nr:darcynin family protein [Allorhizobium sonneratiae]MCM2293445.1 hypothetical protein [Allorhizobium sonneratiae]
MTTIPNPFSIFVLLKTRPGWLSLSRPQRNAIAQAAFSSALDQTDVRVRLFDAEAFCGFCTDIALFETEDMKAFYGVMERLRDSPFFAVPYFDVVQILPSIENGFKAFEASAYSLTKT